MKKEDISLALSIAALGCSIASICRTFSRGDELGIDYLGIIVGMLAFLTAILIAFVWNGYAVRDKEMDRKINLLQNSSKKAIAEDMLYTAYSEMLNAGNVYMSYRIALKKAVAALNLDFTEEKAELICSRPNAKEFIFFWGNEEGCVSNQISDLKLIKNKSKSIDSFIRTLTVFKEEQDRKNKPKA